MSEINIDTKRELAAQMFPVPSSFADGAYGEALETYRSRVCDAVTAFCVTAAELAETTRADALADLPEGTPVPSRIDSAAHVPEAEDAAAAARAEITAAESEAAAIIDADISAPIAPEVSATLQLVAARGIDGERELDALAAAYGSNYQAAQMLAHIAAEAGLIYDDSRLGAADNLAAASDAARAIVARACDGVRYGEYRGPEDAARIDRVISDRLSGVGGAAGALSWMA